MAGRKIGRRMLAGAPQLLLFSVDVGRDGKDEISRTANAIDNKNALYETFKVLEFIIMSQLVHIWFDIDRLRLSVSVSERHSTSGQEVKASWSRSNRFFRSCRNF